MSPQKTQPISLKMAMCFLMILVLALFYVWQHIQSVQLGYGIRNLEHKLVRIQEQNRNLQMELAYEKMPTRILARVRKTDLDLQLPKEWKTVKVKLEPVLYTHDFLTVDWDTGFVHHNPIIRVSSISDGLTQNRDE